PAEAYLAAVERCQTIVDAHQKHIAGKGNTKCARSSDPLGGYSHERIGHRICAVSNLPACIEADFPCNQSPMELTLCFVDPSSGSNVSRPQKVRACGRQRMYTIAPGSTIQQDFDALTKREHVGYRGANAHAAALLLNGCILPTSFSA